MNAAIKENGPHIAMQAVWNVAGVAGLEPATVGFGVSYLNHKNQFDKIFLRKLN
ncbi:hypothetical protein [Shewanella algae]|uniref:hypothetical protein n=1 Tax=Shewanella algae TaxID=38313 RepID=UPI0031F51B45